MTRQEGEFCNKRCPKCGAMLLRNERGTNGVRVYESIPH